MIVEMKAVTLSEVRNIIKDVEVKKELDNYIKKFCNLDYNESKKLFHELNSLNNPKIKDEHIVKIIDILPRDSEEINKIFNDSSLDENEIKAILEIVAKY